MKRKISTLKIQELLGKRPKSDNVQDLLINEAGNSSNVREKIGLFPLTDVEDYNVDIVAVHGIGGDWARTWTHNESQKLWLRDFLPSSLPTARVWSYGYNATTVFSKAVTDIDQVAMNLLAALRNERRQDGDKPIPIIFICHSLGGIIIKKALIIAHEQSSTYGSLLRNVRGLVFLSVPHRGSNVAAWMSIVASICKVVTLNTTTNSSFVNALRRNSKEFADTSRQFTERARGLLIRTFYETERTGGQLIVDEDSARLNILEEVVVPVLGADHVSICKFRSIDSPNYKLVLGALEELVQSATHAASVPHTLTLDEMECLQTLCTSDYESFKRRNPPRTPGTCEWFLQHVQYRRWTRGETPGLLWLSADPGCGKSVLASFLVDELPIQTKSVVCYYFFKDDNLAQSSATHALCALLHQLFSAKRFLVKYALSHYQAKNARFTEELGTLWRICMDVGRDPRCGRVIWIMDGLDECQDSHQKYLIQWLVDCYSPRSGTCAAKMNIQFIITSRPYTSIESAFYDLPGIRLKAEDETNLVSEDIEKVVKTKMDRIGSLKHLSARVIEDLVGRLIQGADRTFLWISLVLENLEHSAETSPGALKSIIGSSPTTLFGVYEKMVEKSTNRERTRKLLHIIVAAAEPLTLKQVNLALCIKHDTSLYPEEDVLESNIRLTIRNTCGPFVRVVDSCVYLVHQTAREFLLSKDSSHSMNLADAHLMLGDICMTYLLFPVFENYTGNTGVFKFTMPEEFGEQHYFFDYAARYWDLHLREAGSLKDARILKMVLDLCDTESTRFKLWMNTHRRYASSPTDTDDWVKLSVVSCLGLEDPLRAMLEAGADIEWMDGSGRRAIHWAAFDAHEATVRLLLGFGPDIEAIDNSRWTPLHCAVYRGSSAPVVKLFLEAGADVHARTMHKQQPLHLVHDRDTAKLLLDRGADVMAMDDERRTPLHNVAYTQDPSIVKLLLDAGADVHARTLKKETPLHFVRWRHPAQVLVGRGADVMAMDEGNQTPLHSAAATQDPFLVELFLDEGADVHARTLKGQTPLHFVRNRTVAKLLLDRGADIMAMDKDKQTPLHIVANTWESSVVELFLDAGADVNARTLKEETPLHLVRKQTVAKMLLDRGADIMATDEDKRSPLHNVANTLESSVVELFLDAGADVNARTLKEETPLHFVRKRTVAELLLDRGANVMAIDADMRTPLHNVADIWELSLVELFLNEGANVHSRTLKGQTPLHFVRQRDIAKLLLDRGADVTAIDVDKQTPLHNVAATQDSSLVELFLDEGADIHARTLKGQTPLHFVQTRAVARLLLDRGADVTAIDEHQRTPLHIVANTWDPSIIQLFLDEGADIHARTLEAQTSLHLVRDRDVAKLLLDHGADVTAVDVGRRTPLHNVADTWDPSLVELFLDAGADVHARTLKGQTPLHFVQQGDTALLLLDHGADIDALSKRGETPLHCAAASLQSSLAVNALLASGADVNATDSEGRTPLHYTANCKPPHEEFYEESIDDSIGPVVTAKLLLAAGAVVYKVDSYGLTPLQYALQPSGDKWLDEIRQRVAQLLRTRNRAPECAVAELSIASSSNTDATNLTNC